MSHTRVRVIMGAGVLGVVLLAPWDVAAGQPPAPPGPPAAPAVLTEAEIMTIENIELKAALRQLRVEAAAREATLTEALLGYERQALEARLRARLKPPVETVFDWRSRAFVPRPASEGRP